MALPLFFALGRIALSKRMAGIAALLVALATAAPEGYWNQMGTTFNPETNYNFNTDYGRLNIAKRGIGYMLRYPVFGVGMANFGRAEGTISELSAQRARAGLSVPWIAPHNTFVQVGAEMGIPALLLWLGMLWAGTVGLLRLRKRIPKAWERQSGERRFLRDATLFLPISFLGFATTSFFLSHAYTPPFYILLAITAGVVALTRKELAADKLGVKVAGGVNVRARSRTPGEGVGACALPASGT